MTKLGFESSEFAHCWGCARALKHMEEAAAAREQCFQWVVVGRWMAGQGVCVLPLQHLHSSSFTSLAACGGLS